MGDWGAAAQPPHTEKRDGEEMTRDGEGACGEARNLRGGEGPFPWESQGVERVGRGGGRGGGGGFPWGLFLPGFLDGLDDFTLGARLEIA